MSHKSLKPVVPQAGKPLYLAVKDHVRDAIDAGVFRPGEQMPSTKLLSERLDVSLVTAHRALQELVDGGVLSRAQGKGTFVHARYFERDGARTSCRIGLLLNDELTLSGGYHGEIFDGIRQAAQHVGADLLLLRSPEDIRRECGGFIAIDSIGQEAAQLASRLTRRQPMLTAGAPPAFKEGASIHIDSADVAGMAMRYLRELGHQRIGFVGGPERIGSQRDLWRGMEEAGEEFEPGQLTRSTPCTRLTGEPASASAPAWAKFCQARERPSAIVAGSFAAALLVYQAAASAGVRIPDDLSVMALEDSAAAPLLAPALTAIRIPAHQIGQTALNALCDHLQHSQTPLAGRVLKAELFARRSSAAAQ